jgi:Histidine kinase/Y_Y_Y domain
MNFDGQVEQNYFHEEKISDIFYDRERSYWFSSLQNGVFIVPDMDLLVINAGNSALKDDHLTALKAISADDLLIGTYSGNIYRYSLGTRQIRLLPKSSDAIYRNVTSIIPYDKNTVIAARGGVSVIDLSAGTDRSYSSVYIRDMVIVGDSILFASSAMIGRVNDLDGLVKNRKFHATSIKDIPGKQICYDKTSHTVWLTLNNGLATLQNNECTQFTIDNKPLYCNALYADNNGLWAGTVSDGVYNIRNKKMVLHLDNARGLKGDNVRSVISVHDTLYIATDARVNIYYPGGEFSYLDYTDGVNAKEITSLCIAGGSLFIGTIRGLFQIPLNAVLTNNVPPNISISSVFINGRAQPAGKPLMLPWNSTDILINFSSVALRSRGTFKYMYRIKGFRDAWEKLEGNISYVRLNHLPPGNFTFEVKSVNEDGIPSQSVAAIAITAEAPFWQQWWFYVLITILGSSLVALIFILRIKKIQRTANIRNQVATSQLTALKAQMNPHFMYNTLNSIQDLILQNDIKNTNYYLSRYSTLMRKILESSDSNEIDLSEEIEILQLYMELEKLRFGNEFTFAITVPGDIDTGHIRIPSMIIQPFVENAIKHGLLHKKGEKKLQIVFERIDASLLCTIKDNGIGREKAAEIKSRAPLAPRSFALKATERRLELVNMGRKHKIILKIIDNHDNNTAAGTEVQILIPGLAV